MIRLVVIDCSVSASWFIPDETSVSAEKLLSDTLAKKTVITIPSLWWFEILNVLKSATIRNRMNERTALKTLFFLKEIPLEVAEPDKEGQYGILKSALDEKLSAYDAAYFHLAQSTGAELFTADSDLIGLKKKYPFVKEITDY